LIAGHFAPVAAQLVAHVADRVSSIAAPKPFTVLDAGCGEGYYLHAIADASVPSTQPAPRLIGIDISKSAIQAAARRRFPCVWAVASNRKLPIAPASVDLVISMFGFPVWPEFASVQPTSGHLLLVDAGPDHLIELRTILYPTVNRSSPSGLEAAERAGYRLQTEHSVCFQIALPSQAAIADLLAMTPHDHRAPQAGRQAIAAQNHLSLTADVVFRHLCRE
jgi:23S rRNA (guanine745-N1)-methyltransferase